MPLPAAALPPAAGAFCAGAAAASKHLALRAAPFVDVTTLSTASLTAWLLHYFWKHKVPEWAKEDISFQKLLQRKRKTNKNNKSRHKRLSKNESNDDTTSEEEEDEPFSVREQLEMANLSSVLEKLQALIESVQLDDDHPSMLQQHAALLAYIQLNAQIKRQEQQQKGHQEEQQQKEEDINMALHNHMVNEEKKDDRKSSQETWTSRDSLFEMAQPSPATEANVPQEVYEYVQNPIGSPFRNTLQEALTYATWAYYDNSEVLSEKLADHDFELLEHSLSTRPGHAAYFLAVSSVAKKQLIIGVRGTSTLEDIVTDCCGRPVPLNDRPYYYDHDRGTKLNRSSNFHDPSRIEVKAATPLQVIHAVEDDQGTVEQVEIISGHERIWVEQLNDYKQDDNHKLHLLYCHEGIMLSAKRLVDKIQEQIEHWVLERDYQLVLCGHSLGAGVSILAAALLRSRLPELTHDTTNDDVGGSSRKKMQVFCFAPPPVLDRDAALAASSYCTSIVNNVDMIPRCSLENLLILLEILKGVWAQLQQQDLAPVGPKTTAAFFRKIARGTDGDLLMTLTALRSLMKDALQKVQANQTMPGVIANESKGRCCGSDSAFSNSMDGGRSDQEIVSETQAKRDGVDVPMGQDGAPASPVPLYIPGVVLLAYEPWLRSQNKDDTQAGEDETETDSDNESNLGDACLTTTNVSWKVADGTANALHFLEMDATARMFMDHATTSYYSLLGMEYHF